MSHSPRKLGTRPSTVRWRILAILLAFSFLSWFNRVSMSVAYDERIKDQLGISETAIGYVYSAFLFVYMLWMTPGGWMADRSGARAALVFMGLGSAVFGLLTGMVGLVTTSAVAVLVLLLGVRGCMGLCTAPIYPATGRILAHWFPPHQRAAANGAVMAAALVGISFTYVGFGTLLDWFDWPAAFLITGTITALAGLLWAWYGRNRPEEHPDVSPAEIETIKVGSYPEAGTDVQAGPWLALLRNRSLVLLTISYGAIGYFEYLFYFWMHYYFDDILKVGKSESRLYSTILSLSMAAGMLLGGWLSDRIAQGRGHRFARTTVVVGGMLLGAMLLFGGVLSSSVGWIVICFALAMAAVGATEGPSWATAIELGRKHGATAAGIFNTGGNAGGVVAPIITPLVSNYLGWGAGIALGGVVCLAGATLWWWIDPTGGREVPKLVPTEGITLGPEVEGIALGPEPGIKL
jgi:MFS family permease